MKKIIIDQSLFEKFPDFKRGIIIVKDIDNTQEVQDVKNMLNEIVSSSAGKNNLEHEYVKAWDEIHTQFGSNPNRFPPSIKALLKRVEKGGTLPYINSVVALFNIISIKYLITCGGDDIDTIQGNLHLGFANGNEKFIPLGSQEEEHLEPGEVIYFDDATGNVMCRRWNWRNGDFTKITANTKRMVINLDGLGTIPDEHIVAARDELAQLLQKHCNASLETDFLNSNNSEIVLEE